MKGLIISKESKELIKKHRWWILPSVVVTSFILALALSFSIINDEMNKITQQQCDTQIKEAVLTYNSTSFTQTFISQYSYLVPIIIISLGIGWILHGVGFRVI